MLLDDFKKAFPITKDLGAIRKKGVMLETILERLQELYDFTSNQHDSHMEMGICWNERIRATEGTAKVGYYYGSCSLGGIPTAIVGCSSKEVWIGVRDELRARELVR
jgi:hypothetical protein